MEEARTEAEQIYVNDGGVMKIICPFCGALQTPRRRSYEDAQDAAEDAAAQCDCDEAREWRMRTVAKCTVKPFRADAKPENVEVAACKFSSQITAVISLNKNDGLKIEKKKKTSEAAEI